MHANIAARHNIMLKREYRIASANLIIITKYILSNSARLPRSPPTPQHRNPFKLYMKGSLRITFCINRK